MKKTDLAFLAVVLLVFLPFALSAPLYGLYLSLTASHGMAMSFVKFAVLATLGEMLGLRISTGRYASPGFGTLRGLFTPIPMGRILQELNWQVQWNFVFKKTIPLFWFPAHTVTFLLPSEMRVLFAALLGVALGVILAVAARKKR